MDTLDGNQHLAVEFSVDMPAEQWLYHLMSEEEHGWNPTMAMQSAVNWARALYFEVEQEHGSLVGEQAASCRRCFERVGQRAGGAPTAAVWANLFHSLTFCQTLASMCGRGLTAAWGFPSAIVINYYAVYHALLSMLAAKDGYTGQTHSATIRALNDLRPKLPHPFDMVATYVRNEEYAVCLPHYPEAAKTLLTTQFDGTREDARGKILSYLGGTAKWLVDAKKEELKWKLKITSFRSKEDRAKRDAALPREVNFLNCAFRYRGKANYRDSIYLAYGSPHPWLDARFLESLRGTACFCWVCALVYAERRFGAEKAHQFVEDVRLHLRGHEGATGTERFWEQVGV